MKSIDDLAIFGGKPTFDAKLHVGRPNIGNRNRFIRRIDDILDHRWLTNNGALVREFESRIADSVGVKHCISTCNGTLALQILFKALELKGEVIVPSFTFIATAHALQWLDIAPVFCDVDPNTHNLDPDMAASLITPRTTAILGVHLWGRPCDIERLTLLAGKHHLKLIFDAAHAFGCSHKHRMIGNFGIAETFSFHATKYFNTIEGGAIVTNDDALATKARLMKNFGFCGYDDVASLGTNAKMTEVSAAMGLTNFASLRKFISSNYLRYQRYQKELADMPGVQLQLYDEKEHCNYQYVVLEIDKNVTGIDRDEFVNILHAENVLARRYYYPGCHNMNPYRPTIADATLALPQTERLCKRVLVLPTGPTVSLKDIEKICRIFRLCIEQKEMLRNKLDFVK